MPKSPSSKSQRGFTLVELLVVVVIVTLLAAVFVPAVAGTRASSKSAQCLNNHRRLMVAWQMYASDNQDRLVSPGHWVEDWLGWGTEPGNTNTSILEDPEQSLIARYVRDASLFKCPADPYLSPVQIASGWKQRARSVTLCSSLGGSAVIYYEIPGRTHFVAKQLSELNRPGPANIVATLDEHPDSINNGMFSFDPGLALSHAHWRDLPASYHETGAGLAFADGHAIIKQWQDTRTVLPVTYTKWSTLLTPGNTDYAWMNDHVPYR